MNSTPPPPEDASHQGPARNLETGGESEAKRRRVRKGTRSCWGCRRRKVRCIFASPTAAICLSCQRRGAKCVGQDCPEYISATLDNGPQLGNRIVRVEALVEQLLKNGSIDLGHGCEYTTVERGRRSSYGIHTPASLGLESSHLQIRDKSSAGNETAANGFSSGDTGLQKPSLLNCRPVAPGNHEELSRVLHKHLLSPEDTNIIVKARGDKLIRFHRMLTAPYNQLDRCGQKAPQDLLERPGPNVHPVLIARHMLYIATFLQHLHPRFCEALKEISRPPREIMKQLADAAITFVTMNEDLLGSIEGLECVMLESMYKTNGGHLRNGFIAIRRAMVIAQLMGFHRTKSQARYKVLDPQTEAHPQFVWFRIVSAERHLCLMMGAPQGTLDHSMASEEMLEDDTPMGRLERVHCVIASRILERSQSEPNLLDSSLTQELDAELMRVAEALPSKWWLVANLATVVDKPEALFWDMRRMFIQLFHYNLLNQLHLPYMLRSSVTGHGYDYSRITCINASREVLSRFIMFRNFNQIAFCCRDIDFFSLMAAMTLLLAHLAEHRRFAASLAHSQHQRQSTANSSNLLAHQRLSDRAMMEEAQESMEEVSRLNEDALSAQSADLLKRLLATEAEAADGHAHRAEGVSVQPPHPAEEPGEKLSEDNTGAVRLYIPYFGVITIARQGSISRQVPGAAKAGQHQPQPVHEFDAASASSLDLEAAAQPSSTVETETSFSYDEGLQTESTGWTRSSPAQHVKITARDVLQSPSAMAKATLQHFDYPLITTEIDDWAFQGADLSFFDNLVEGLGDDGARYSEWHNDSI